MNNHLCDTCKYQKKYVLEDDGCEDEICTVDYETTEIYGKITECSEYEGE